MSQAWTSTFAQPRGDSYLQSNGKLERWHRTFKHNAFRPVAPQTLEEAIRVVDDFVHHYNCVRLHSALGYIAPHDFMAGKQQQIWTERDRRLESARALRAQRRAALRAKPCDPIKPPGGRLCLTARLCIPQPPRSGSRGTSTQ